MQLLEQTLLTILVSFTVGVFVAYWFWGTKYFSVLDAESVATMTKQKTQRLRDHQAHLRSRLQKPS